MRRSQAPSLLRLPGPTDKSKLGNSQNVVNTLKVEQRRPITGDSEYSAQKLQRCADMKDKSSMSRENINSFANSVKGSSLFKSPSLMSISQASVVSESPGSMVRAKPIDSKKLNALSSASADAKKIVSPVTWNAEKVKHLGKDELKKRTSETTILGPAKLAEKVDISKKEDKLAPVQDHASKQRTSTTVIIKENKVQTENENSEYKIQNDKSVLPSATSTEQLPADSIDTRISSINSNLVLCKPTKHQILCIETILLANESTTTKMESVQRVLLHPGTISNISSDNWDGTESGKLAVLRKILQNSEATATILIVVAAEETKVSLSEFFGCEQSITGKRIDTCCLTEISSISEQKFDIVVAFDVFPKHYIPVFEQLLKPSGAANYLQLITQGTLEERLLWSHVTDDAIATFTDSELQHSFSSLIRDRLVSRSRKFAGAVDDEFAELWPKLLDCDWHAEAGGGLVDYHYCLPGYTSKSVKGKIKGQKNVHFFTSKSKVLDYLRKPVESDRKISAFELGAFDLSLWHFEPKPKDGLFTGMTDAEVHSVYSYQQRIAGI